MLQHVHMVKFFFFHYLFYILTIVSPSSFPRIPFLISPHPFFFLFRKEKASHNQPLTEIYLHIIDGEFVLMRIR